MEFEEREKGSLEKDCSGISILESIKSFNPVSDNVKAAQTINRLPSTVQHTTASK